MYATREQLVLRFGEPEISQLERSLDQSQSVNSALQDASDLADGYIGVAYSLPLPEAPQNLQVHVCNIARYLLWKNKASEEVRLRYEDAIDWLKSVAAKRAILTIKTGSEDDTQVTQANARPSTMPIGSTYRGGVFSDDVLDTMPRI